MRVPLYLSCPVCLDQGFNTVKDYWYHPDPCGGLLSIDENAFIHCESCFSHWHISVMKMKCSSGRHDFRIPSKLGIAESVSTASQLVEKKGLAWLQRILDNL